MGSLGDNLNNIPKNEIDPNKDKDAFQNDKSDESKNKRKSKIPKNHLISNVIGNLDESMVTRRQSRLNDIGFICYTF